MKYKKVTDLNEIDDAEPPCFIIENGEYFNARTWDFGYIMNKYRQGNLYIEDDTPEPEVLEVVEMSRGGEPVVRVPLSQSRDWLELGWRIVKTKVVDYEQ